MFSVLNVFLGLSRSRMDVIISAPAALTGPHTDQRMCAKTGASPVEQLHLSTQSTPSEVASPLLTPTPSVYAIVKRLKTMLSYVAGVTYLAFC